ncbi:MAG TPA: hypothetical protein VMA34_01485, partial [Terracidiphilus sp.]|nr:hypothetical protein [Terracidiphilus sp.]
LAARTTTRRGWGTRAVVEIDALGRRANPTLAARTKTRRGWGTRAVVEIEALGRLSGPSLS